MKTPHSVLILVLALLTACGKQGTPAPQAANSPQAAPEAPGISPSEAVTFGTKEGESADSFFDPSKYPDAVQGSFVDPAKLTKTERLYGVAPQRDSHVTYQDDVILMEHGDEAVREAKSDGMTFSFDPKAEHVSEFAVGKIVFATGRVLGRIAQIQPQGDGVAVKLAPVSITEVVKKGTFMMNSTFNPKDLIIYTAADFPSTLDVNAPQQSRDAEPQRPQPEFLPAGFIKTQTTPGGLGYRNLTTVIPTQPPTLPAPPLNLNAGLSVTPAIGSDGGIGLSFAYIDKGVIFKGFGQLVIPSPKVRFLLDIDASGVKTFGIELSGGTSIRLQIVASADVERYINVNTTTVAPLDLTLPCPIAGLPLAVSFKTSFNLHTDFSAKSSTLTSSGAWNMHGTLFAGYKSGSKSHETPDTQATASLAENVSGVSLGINRIGGAVNVRPMVGLGGFGFMTGVWLGVTFTGDVVKQASQAMIDCHGANGSATMDSGLGYQIPSSIAALVNKALSLVTTYRLEKEKTLISGWSGPLFNISQDIPVGCAGMSGKGAGTNTT